MAAKKTPIPIEFMTVKDAARLCDVTPGMIRQALQSGQIRGFKANERGWLCYASSVLAYKSLPYTTGRPRTNDNRR